MQAVIVQNGPWKQSKYGNIKKALQVILLKIVTEEMKTTIRQLKAEQMSYAEIGRRLEISECTAKYWSLSTEERDKIKTNSKLKMLEYANKRDELFREKGCVQCPICKKEKAYTEFYKHQRICKECQDTQNNAYFKTYRRTEKVKEKDRNRRRDAKKYIAYILGGKCADCGRAANDDNLFAFDFHHIDLSDKETKSEWRRKKFLILVYAGKIRLLCAYCHRVAHHKNWDRMYVMPKAKMLKQR
jgi:hypothetical protein